MDEIASETFVDDPRRRMDMQGCQHLSVMCQLRQSNAVRMRLRRRVR